MKRLNYIIITCLCTALATQAQEVKIMSNNEPVAHAAIQITPLNQTATTHYISDHTGTVNILQTPPYIATVSHLNFETHTDTIHHSNTNQWQLRPKENTLDEIVITGQYQPQSVKQSVYKVQVIDQTRLQAQGVQSLPEVLATQLNFRFQRDNAVGSSSARLQGLSGQNIKVLIDGVPMVGRSGVSNEIDLSQINVNTIAQIEIIEGPMAVNYGADALAGVINIITKKPDAHKWSLDMEVQEETAGQAFSLLDQGIHNGSLAASYRLNNSWSIQAESRYYKFGGWGGEGRDQLWYPKTQFFQSGLLRYEKDNLSIYYRLDYLNETIANLGAPEQVSNQEDPYAFDKEYLTHRWVHQMQAAYDLRKGTLNTVVSYTDYSRVTHRFKSFLIPGVSDVTTTDGQDSVSFHTAFFRSTLDQALGWSIGHTDWQTQFGIDGSFDSSQGTTLSTGDKQMTNLGFFASAEISLGNQFKIRPGIRATYNSTFATRPTFSINTKYDLTTQSQLRVSYGRGFRAPSLRELYHEFVDNNHNILGNTDLEPEYSHNINGDFTHQFKNQIWQFSLSGFYNDIHNQITYFTPAGANQPTTYTNLLQYKTLGGTGSINFKKGKLKAKIGASYLGRYHGFSSEAADLGVPTFLYSPEVIASLQYLLPLQVQLAAFYKYTGASKQYLEVAQADGSSSLELKQLDAFHFLDVTLSKTFFHTLSFSLGAKNIFDITTVNNGTNTSGAHSSGSGQSSIAYGRSYFIKLNYHISK